MIELEDKSLYFKKNHKISEDELSCSCGYTSSSHWSIGQHWIFFTSIREDPIPHPELIGTAVSPAGRTNQHVFLSHILVDAQPMDTMNGGWLEKHREGYEAARDMVVAAVNAGRQWNTSTMTLSYHPWMCVIKKKGAQDRYGMANTRLMAIADGVIYLSKLERKGWNVDMATTHSAPVELHMKIDTLITGLVKRARNASTTSARIARIREIEQVESYLNILADLRESLTRKVWP